MRMCQLKTNQGIDIIYYLLTTTKINIAPNYIKQNQNYGMFSKMASNNAQKQ